MSIAPNTKKFLATVEVDTVSSKVWSATFPLFLLFEGMLLCFSGLMMSSGEHSEPTVVSSSKPVSIEDVQLGWRVVGENPLGPEDNATEPNQQSWKKVVLQHRSEEGSLIEIEFLRPNAWFEKWRAEVGRTIDLSLSEPGKSGIARVIAVEPCPQIKPGTGPVVTGLFRHVCEEGELVRVEVGDDVEPIISTFNHQFWSETRNEFIQAADLQPSEQLRCADKKLVSVKQITTVAGAKPVFNLKTHNHHVYAVGFNGMLVHNMYGDLNISKNRAPSLRSTKDRLNFRGEPNSAIRGNDAVRKGGGKRVFVTDNDGKIVKEITPQRLKVREVTGTNPEGVEFETFKKIKPVPIEDVKVLDFFND